jgi:YVTN family beta-propeller protein
VLSDPQSKEIAKLSGIPEDPQESSTCLGCHATGAHAEDWEKDETFFVEDGVQCEKCHGPGSEYIAVMNDRELSVRAGLIIQTAEDCKSCHQLKESHKRVHLSELINLDEGMKEIAHPSVNLGFGRGANIPTGQKGEFKYVGVNTCGQCHKGPKSSYQFSKWRMSKHAQAYSVLATEKAYELAEKEGIKDPQSSDKCLKCHSTVFFDPAGGAVDTYSIDEGVGCEACHGPGSKYYKKAVMSNPELAREHGLREVTREICLGCHEEFHKGSFDYDRAIKEITHPYIAQKEVTKTIYKTPLGLEISPDGKLLYVTCEAAGTVIVVDVAKQEKIDEIPVGRQPTGVTFSPDGNRAYISNRLDDSVSMIDVSRGKVVKTFNVGDEPHGLVVDVDGKYLYVLNTTADSISVVDIKTLKEVKRLTASRHPWALSLSPDGKQIYVTNSLSRFVGFRETSLSEITVIDTDLAMISDRIEVPAVNLMQGIDWHPSGNFAFITLNRTKNLIPMTRLLQGWTITNGLGVVWKDGRTDQVLLDEPGLCFPDPTDVAITPDGRLALVTSSGSDRIAVVDVFKLISMLKAASDYEREHVFPNHLGKSTEFVIAHIPTKNSPRGIIISPDGKTAFATNALDDSLTVIDLKKFRASARIDLGGPKEITKTRYGERLFHSADITFNRQFSCHSCHPDGHIDGLTYDIEPDGIGNNPVDNRTLRGILDTAPFKWEGTNPSLQRQCGPRLAVFFTRLQPYNPEELEALENYICLIKRPPNRHRPLGAELTDAQRRGKMLFERAVTNDGRVIPKQDRCVTCHFPPLYTDRQIHDLGNEFEYDENSIFDTPHLLNIYDSAPYLHNGIANTLEEIWTLYNPEDKHGVTNDMTKDQLNDLIEYLKTL